MHTLSTSRFVADVPVGLNKVHMSSTLDAVFTPCVAMYHWPSLRFTCWPGFYFFFSSLSPTTRKAAR